MKMKKANIKVVAYYRVSSRKQEKRQSIDTQKEEMIPWMEEQGFDVKEYQDDGISGEEISKRPAFQKVLKSKRKHWCLFAVNRIGRFRVRADRNVITQHIIDNKIWVHSLTEGSFNPEDEDDMDQLEKLLTDARRENRARTKLVVMGQKRAMKNNLKGTGGEPYGLSWIKRVDDNTPGHFEVNQEEYETLKEMFRLLTAGWGLKKTADILNQDLQKYPTRTGVKWTDIGIHAIIHNDYYHTGILIRNRMDRHGKPKPKGEHIDVNPGVGPLFSEADVKLVRHTVSARRRRKTNDTKIKDNFLLHGLVRCGECGARLGIMALKNNKYEYYRCIRQIKGDCDLKYIRADALDLAVWQKFIKTFSDPDKLRKAIAQEEFLPKSKRRDLTAQVKKARADKINYEQSLDRAQELYVSGDWTKKKYEAKKAKYEKLITKAEDEERKAQQTLVKPGKAMKSINAATKAVARYVSRIRDAVADEGLTKESLRRVNLERKAGLQHRRADTVRAAIFQQKREILSRFVAVGGQIKVWDANNFEITGTLPLDHIKDNVFILNNTRSWADLL